MILSYESDRRSYEEAGMNTRMDNRVLLGAETIEWSDRASWASIPYVAEIIPEGPGVYEVVRQSKADGIRLQIGKPFIYASI